MTGMQFVDRRPIPVSDFAWLVMKAELEMALQHAASHLALAQQQMAHDPELIKSLEADWRRWLCFYQLILECLADPRGLQLQAVRLSESTTVFD
jgi:hypothetical protein